MPGAGVNATQGSLLGFLFDGPKSGWDLLQEIQAGLAGTSSRRPKRGWRGSGT